MIKVAVLGATGYTLTEVVGALNGERVAAIGITDQRETIVAWDRTTGAPRTTGCAPTCS